MSEVCLLYVIVDDLFDCVSEFSLKVPRNNQPKSKRTFETMQSQKESLTMQRCVISRKDSLDAASTSFAEKIVVKSTISANDLLFQEFFAKIEQHVPSSDIPKLNTKLLEVRSVVDNNYDDKVLLHKACQDFNKQLLGDCFELRGKIYELVQQCVVDESP